MKIQCTLCVGYVASLVLLVAYIVHCHDSHPYIILQVINGKSTTFSDKGVLKAVFIIIKPLAQLYKREKHVYVKFITFTCVHYNSVVLQ